MSCRGKNTYEVKSIFYILRLHLADQNKICFDKEIEYSNNSNFFKNFNIDLLLRPHHIPHHHHLLLSHLDIVGIHQQDLENSYDFQNLEIPNL